MGPVHTCCIDSLIEVCIGTWAGITAEIMVTQGDSGWLEQKGKEEVNQEFRMRLVIQDLRGDISNFLTWFSQQSMVSG